MPTKTKKRSVASDRDRDRLRASLLVLPLFGVKTMPDSQWPGMPSSLVRTLNGAGREQFGTLSHDGVRVIVRVK